MLLRRYGLVCLAALPVGFVLGALLFGAVVLAGNPDWRRSLAVGMAWGQGAAYGATGAAAALCAAAGGTGMIAVFDPALLRSRSERVLLGGFGSAVGIVALGTLGAAVQAVSGPAQALPSGVLLYAAVVLAVPAAAAGGSLVFLAEACSSRLRYVSRRLPRR